MSKTHVQGQLVEHSLLNRMLSVQDRAIVTENETITYEQLHEMIKEKMLIYRKLKVKPGDQVGLFVKNPCIFLIHYLALWDFGVTVVLFDHQIKLDKFEKQLRSVDLSWLFTDQDLAFGSQIQKIETIDTIAIYSLKVGLHQLQHLYPNSEGFVILFTSGTQNEPKAVVLLKKCILNNVQKVIEYTRLTKKDKTLLTLPLSYSYAMSQCLAHLFKGGEIHLIACGFIGDLILIELQKRKITNFAATPYFYEMIAHKIEHETLNLMNFFVEGRFLMNAGGYLSPNCIEKILKNTLEISFFNNYGQTEASPRLSFDEFTSESKDFSGVGYSLKGVELKIIDPDENNIGKIYYRSEDYMEGYYHALPRKSFLDFVPTGDIGYFKESGQLVIVGRSDSMIKLNGRKCYINHIEEQILLSPKVKHVKIVKSLHDIYGEFLTAHIVPIHPQLNSKLFIEDLKMGLRAVLMSYEIPKIFFITDKIHLSSNGKVQKANI